MRRGSPTVTVSVSPAPGGMLSLAFCWSDVQDTPRLQGAGFGLGTTAIRSRVLFLDLVE